MQTAVEEDLSSSLGTGTLLKDDELQHEVNEGLCIDIAKSVAKYCKDRNIMDPVEILIKLQQEMVIGRELELTDPTQTVEGSVSYLTVDRYNMLQTGLDEISVIEDLRKTIDVQFYLEVGMI